MAIYSDVGTGGSICGGLSIYTVVDYVVVTSGITGAGSALIGKLYQDTSSGGVLLNGESLNYKNFNYSISSGIVCAGSAALLKIFDYISSGGLTGGSSSSRIVTVRYIHVFTGGLIGGGNAIDLIRMRQIASGGVLGGGLSLHGRILTEYPYNYYASVYLGGEWPNETPDIVDGDTRHVQDGGIGSTGGEAIVQEIVNIGNEDIFEGALMSSRTSPSYVSKVTTAFVEFDAYTLAGVPRLLILYRPAPTGSGLVNGFHEVQEICNPRATGGSRGAGLSTIQEIVNIGSQDIFDGVLASSRTFVSKVTTPFVEFDIYFLAGDSIMFVAYRPAPTGSGLGGGLSYVQEIVNIGNEDIFDGVLLSSPTSPSYVSKVTTPFVEFDEYFLAGVALFYKDTQLDLVENAEGGMTADGYHVMFVNYRHVSSGSSLLAGLTSVQEICNITTSGGGLGSARTSPSNVSKVTFDPTTGGVIESGASVYRLISSDRGSGGVVEGGLVLNNTVANPVLDNLAAYFAGTSLNVASFTPTASGGSIGDGLALTSKFTDLNDDDDEVDIQGGVIINGTALNFKRADIVATGDLIVDGYDVEFVSYSLVSMNGAIASGSAASYVDLTGHGGATVTGFHTKQIISLNYGTGGLIVGGSLKEPAFSFSSDGGELIVSGEAYDRRAWPSPVYKPSGKLLCIRNDKYKVAAWLMIDNAYLPAITYCSQEERFESNIIRSRINRTLTCGMKKINGAYMSAVTACSYHKGY